MIVSCWVYSQKSSITDARLGSTYASDHDLICDSIYDNFNQNFVWFDDIASLNKAELDFSLTLCNAIHDQYLFFVHSYAKSKMKEKVTMWLKNRFSNHWLMVRLNLCSDDKRNCKKTTLVKQRNSQFGVQTRTFIWKIQTIRQVYSKWNS